MRKTPLGFIGTGVMGRHMAGHLLDAGHPLHLHSRTRAKAQPLMDCGAVWHDTPAALAAECGVIFTMVGFPADVEQVYFGADGLLDHVRPGTRLVDFTTSSPELARRIAEAAAARNCTALDAPVSGGDTGAKNAALSIMIGGDPDAAEALRPLFELLGKTIVYQGPAGSGQHCKMCNQITIAANMLGVCEALAYARESGLDPETVLESISSGAAGSWSLSNLAPRMLADDFDPGFYVKHFIKDMSIAAESAENLHLDLPGLLLALERYKSLAARGGEDDGTQALYRLYKQQPD